MSRRNFNFALVIAYGRILPKALLEAPIADADMPAIVDYLTANYGVATTPK